MTCRWAQQLDPMDYAGVTSGCDFECHKRPPQMLADDGAVAYWPVTHQFDWCGEWEDQFDWCSEVVDDNPS